MTVNTRLFDNGAIVDQSLGLIECHGAGFSITASFRIVSNW
ncbi:hypothetical protein [Novosphingobium sp.]|nr:hypothetical protein [Novosphingobium sp.]